VGSLRRRADRLEEAHGLVRATLVCPDCGEEFVVFGDAPMEYLTAEWTREAGAQSYRETPPDIAALFDHEHAPSDFLEKTSGLPWLSREVSGMNLGAG
jgi:hypothetical protein